jgi:hypothetical protein
LAWRKARKKTICAIKNIPVWVHPENLESYITGPSLTPEERSLIHGFISIKNSNTGHDFITF